MKKTELKKLNPRNGENSRMIRLLMQSQTLPKIDITDPEQVQGRISEYFDFCQMHNLFPSISGLSSWLGVHRDTIHSWKTGQFRRETHQKIIQRAYDVIEAVLVDELMDNRISSPVGIFMLKSMFGYKDRVDLGLEAGIRRDPLSDLRITDPELIRKYLVDAVPDEDIQDGKTGD